MIELSSPENNTESRIVNIYYHIFSFLNRCSLFELAKFLFKPIYTRNNYLFVENWVLGNVGLSILGLLISYFLGNPKWVIIIFITYGSLRVLEILFYQVNLSLFAGYKPSGSDNGSVYALKSYRRMVILLIHNFFEIICWFSYTYLYFIKSFKIENNLNNDTLQAIYMSFVTMTTFGQPNFEIYDKWSLLTISLEAFIGLIMTLLVLSRFIALLPHIKSKDPTEMN